ncbi:MAG TPA: DNA polymerase III subunit delta' [Solimonas sp.]
MSADPLRPLPWQEALWLELTSLTLQSRLSHALLLAGPAGIGKRHFARAFAAFLLCEARSGYACGKCRACVQLSAATHPDASLLSRDGHVAISLQADAAPETALIHWEPRPESKRKDIAIGAVHSLIESLAQASHYGGQRVIVVEPADLLNESSANALLKIVEEPPAGTHLLFICERPSQLKPTLRSRCQRIRMVPPTTDEAIAWLQQQDATVDAALLAEAGGAPLRALALADNDGVAQRRAWRELWTGVAQMKRDPISAAATVDKDSVVEHLQWASAWLLELLRQSLRQGRGANSENLDLMIGEVLDAQRRAAGTASPQLLLESLFVQWLRVGRAVLA